MGRRFDTIQILRGLAATLVVGMHMLHGVEAEGFHSAVGELLFTNGLLGVDIFFVISGFIIYYVGFSGDRPSALSFLANRFFRIFPPYWAVLAFAISLAVGLAIVFGDTSKLPSAREVAVSLLLVPANPDSYVIGVAWTLALEVVFYLLFALIALPLGANAFFLAISGWFILGLAGLFVAGDFSGKAFPILNPVVIEFLYGALIARAFLRGGTRHHGAAFVVGALAFAGLILFQVEQTALFRREVVYGIPAAILIYGAVGLNIKWPSVALLWGESSYILYLLHIPFFMLVGRGVETATGFNVYSSPVSAFGMVVLVTLASMAIAKWIERPYQRSYKTMLKTPPRNSIAGRRALQSK